MPELPEVETVRRGLAPVMEGARIVRVEQRRANLRTPFPEGFVARLEGATVTALSRRAKYLLADLSTGAVLIAHLGMSGSFRVRGGAGEETPGVFHHGRDKAATHDHVVFHLDGPHLPGGATVTYNDPRRFGFMDLVERADLPAHPSIAGLGVEPLGNALDADLLARLFSERSTPLKSALLDQRLIAGLGNIYVCEALWRAGLDPRAAAGTTVTTAGAPSAGLVRLAAAIRAVLEEAIAAGGSSLRDHRQANGELGYFQHAFSVYDREGSPCPRPTCDGVIERVVQSGRSTFFCPRCQRRGGRGR
ncbi:bifunctional DNA-formamidopyrimidine glycosylase/DNA-(apurinic or apyrimidinic site) lyase [Pinisolibacter aquiterrae]|uniref:bifunctional DNA-formamidopyrimidine glycosylase/DNA-(apurinic or apyrimidinic site) lyase n=1 Tax=Pinisolibacter aquiterrae TaxID=2815579 RepID=UPI001C3D4981|nr:bifunctional DNA-formamidopyrimidine glycosylase/DNA-(apurinic or apyrimidinic site) lyase [Pinisolibacter aquiterrae]MBV5266584.1 bifunctional DNA-formamidopyrimidine glycosylase/DNA-(apurinic or apyrimidinic site) lyase [Pinisolibacter aquiterrae]MCC8234643.1 bifunctional DNA-formamidopyrimidine glycosylase/DNA-(apurinic or apyrimidinic site) lyase [Pinisolibacter aquiterrae]